MVMGVNTLNQILPNLCESAGLSRKTCHCLRVICATKRFHCNAAEKSIIKIDYWRMTKKRGAGVESEHVLGLPNLEANTKKNQEQIGTDYLLGFGVPDEVLCNIPLPEPEVQQEEKMGSWVLSCCIFNNCTIDFGSLSSG